MLDLEKIIDVLQRQYGLDISMYESSFLLKTVEKRANSINRASLSTYIDILVADVVEANALHTSLNINYSEFFRNSITFSLLENIFIPRLIEEKGPNSGIRVWSAGCAAGQEAYSLAMILDEVIRRKEKEMHFRVFGTDTSEKTLAAAKNGIFDAQDVQNVSLKMLARYFNAKRDMYSVSSYLKDHVDFSYHNLLDPRSVSPAASIFGDFDIICCCNLLFYFNPEMRQVILNKLYLSMAPGGLLVTGEAERDIVAKNRFRGLSIPAAIFQKTNR